MTDTRVRRVEAGEWTTLRAVRLAALADAPEAFGSTLAREEAFGEAEWRRRATTPVFIAWRAGEAVGLVSVIRRQDGAGTASGPEWHLMSMWVSPDARGSGAADLLVSAAVETARAGGAERVTLWVADGNDRARAFYVRNGFRASGVRHTFTRDDGSAFDGEMLVLHLANSA